MFSRMCFLPSRNSGCIHLRQVPGKLKVIVSMLIHWQFDHRLNFRFLTYFLTFRFDPRILFMFFTTYIFYVWRWCQPPFSMSKAIAFCILKWFLRGEIECAKNQSGIEMGAKMGIYLSRWFPPPKQTKYLCYISRCSMLLWRYVLPNFFLNSGWIHLKQEPGKLKVIVSMFVLGQCGHWLNFWFPVHFSGIPLGSQDFRLVTSFNLLICIGK